MSEIKDLYTNYQDWKSWEEFFVYSPDQAGYYSAEFEDIAILDAEVLEIGFGSGSCVAWMKEQGANVSVTEISERACSAARALGLEVLSANLPDDEVDHLERFDTIIAFDVFEHLDLKAVGRYLDTCSAILKPGGRLLLRFPNAQSPFGLKPQAGDPTHKSELSLAVFQLLLMGRSYDVVRYGASYFHRGRPLTLIWLKRSIRRALQKSINRLLGFIYASGIPYEPVVVIVLEKKNKA